MHIGRLFILLGLVFTAIGIAAPWIAGAWPAMIALWPGAALLVVGGAYLRGAPGVLGKRADGSMSVVRILALLPYFVLTWGLWRLLRLGPEPAHDRVAPDLYLGRRPFPHELPDDVRIIVDLTAEFPRSIEPKEGQAYVCLPTLDAFVPSVDSCVDLVARIAAHPGPAYIHCAQGHGRSALIAGALLVHRGIATGPGDAEALMKRARPGVHLSSSQRQMLGLVCDRLAQAPSRT